MEPISKKITSKFNSAAALGLFVIVSLTFGYTIYLRNMHSLNRLGQLEALAKSQSPLIVGEIANNRIQALKIRMGFLTLKEKSSGFQWRIENSQKDIIFSNEYDTSQADRLVYQTELKNIDILLGTLRVSSAKPDLFSIFIEDNIWLSLIATAALFILLLFVLKRNIREQVEEPLNQVMLTLDSDAKFEFSTLEWNRLVSEIEKFKENLVVKQKMEAQLEQNRALTALASQVAHDIRSPIAAIQMVMSMSKSFEGDERKIIELGVQRVNEVADSLLNKRREAVSHIERPTAVTNIFKVIEDVILEKQTISAGRFLFEFNRDASADLYANTISSDILRRVLSNLVGNSMEASKSGQRISVLLEHKAEVSAAEIVIEDHGCGISAVVLKEILSENKSYGKIDGNGLGLLYARTEVEKSGGKFRIESEINKGTRVFLELPIMPHLT